ncbi:MAG: thiamine-phosphate kinase [Candidatus Hydrogenedentes bacterium]|nr:thiamine-phosphate kinase [Candidatus Hydrogenedentota bacterium]
MQTLRDIGEFGLIDRLERFLPTSPLVIEGIGDDCAVLRFGDKQLLVSTDLFVENVHFRREWAAPADIGWKAAASSLSDIAAMGGAPLFCLTSLACPADTPTAFVEEMYQGLSSAMSRFSAVIVGGDTTCTESGIALDVIVIGETVGNRCLRRHGAEAGDHVVVTGHCGMSAAGLHALRHGHDVPELVLAHLRPTPRISEGQWLCRRTGVHAMIDVSDGLVQDLGHIASFSYLGINLMSETFPVPAVLSRYAWENQCKPDAFVLHGGEDYELAFTVAAAEANAVLDAFHHEFRVETTTIGVVTDKWLGVRIDGEPIEAAGYDHFKNAPYTQGDE